MALTPELIADAQNNDMNAITVVIREMEPRMTQIANRVGTPNNHDDLMQDGRMALWAALPRFTGGSVDNFHAFMYRTIEGTMYETAREERNAGATGADRDAMKLFTAYVREYGDDLDVIEQMVQTDPGPGKRLSATRAHAARMAWEGSVSLDMPNGEEGASLADVLETNYGVPEELVTPEDLNADAAKHKRALVRAVIETMGDKQARVLRARWGIGERDLGSGTEADEILAAELKCSTGAVRFSRTAAHKSFAKRYGKITGLTPCTCDRCNAYRKSEGVTL
ncbi:MULTISPECIES: sigma factor [unclassified Streptomyces]|uniref:sigma factor n=1 Tax=Streptomyces sp. NPDC056835 TaxID=3345956 RepID=UPI00368AC272